MLAPGEFVMRSLQLVTGLLLQRNREYLADRLVSFDAQTAGWLEASWQWLPRKLRLVEGLARQLHWRRWILLVFAALLLTGLAGMGYQLLRLLIPGLVLTGNSGQTSLSFQVERRRGDLLLTWDRNTATVLHAQAGVLRIRDGNSAQQELQLDADQLRKGNLRYTPVSDDVQFQMQVSNGGGRTVSEWVLALTAPRGTTLTRQQHGPLARHPVSHKLYTVQVGTFRNLANARRLCNEMEGRYGSARLVSQASNPSLWRVVVGRETTIEDASRLAERIRSDGYGKTTQILVVGEAVIESIRAVSPLRKPVQGNDTDSKTSPADAIVR